MLAKWMKSSEAYFSILTQVNSQNHTRSFLHQTFLHDTHLSYNTKFKLNNTLTRKKSRTYITSHKMDTNTYNAIFLKNLMRHVNGRSCESITPLRKYQWNCLRSTRKVDINTKKKRSLERPHQKNIYSMCSKASQSYSQQQSSQN